MKKKHYKKNIIILLCIIAITVLFIFIYNNNQKKEVLFLAIYSDLCDRQEKIYIEEDGINIYTICIDNILTNKKENLKQKIVNGKNFSQKENGVVLMGDDLRKKLLVEWQNKKKEVITHPYLKEKVEWGMVPYVQAMLLARYLRGDLDGYPVFLWK